MGEYVEIRTSVADILNIANGLQAKGDALTSSLNPLLTAITTIESHPETLPKDEFTDGFLTNYESLVPAGDGTTLTANEAVKTSARQFGPALTDIGKAVAKAMWSYSGADDDNAADVRDAGTV